MIVDRRKDSYDELMMLSRDSRLDRNRKSRWTTGIVATAVVASGIYVGGTNEHLADLAKARTTAVDELQTTKDKLDEVTKELDALKTEREFTRQNQEWFRDLALSLGADPKVIEVIERIGPTPDTEPQIALSNVVWVVDGSRRFPMAAGDILWIPEGQFWVKLDSPTGDPRRPKPHGFAIYQGSEIVSTTAPMARVDFPKNEEGTGYIGHYDTVIPPAAAMGTATCVRLTLHDPSKRPGFVHSDYVDMEVLYHVPTTGDPCISESVEIR